MAPVVYLKNVLVIEIPPAVAAWNVNLHGWLSGQYFVSSMFDKGLSGSADVPTSFCMLKAKGESHLRFPPCQPPMSRPSWSKRFRCLSTT